MTAGPGVTSTRLLLTGFAAGVLLHVDRAPPWCSGVALAAVIWYALHSRNLLRLPPAILRLLLTLTLFAVVATSFRGLSGLAAGSALLIVMGAAKLLETRSRRDATVVATVTLVLVLAAALDRQALLRVPLYFGTAWIALATIAALGGARESRSGRRALRSAGLALVYAAPFAALCFVLVPRLPGALWSMPGGDGGQTGLSDEMSPGSISDLSISDDIAFRVRFEGAPPPLAARYWRGPVLHQFDGYTWRRQPGQIAIRQDPSPASPLLRYHVMLEPHGRNYLFGLDTIAGIEGPRNFRTFDGQIIAQRNVTSAIAYEGASWLHTKFSGTLSLNGRRIDTQLPPGRNPRSAALAQQLHAGTNSTAQYALRVLDYFRAAGFEYTLTPPLLDYNSIDDLIFNTRLGFCGHFASAYVMLMRAAGVPARVVTGYMGGSWNPVGGYYVVRQSEAHAWAEIWIDGEGWTRIDPTAVVAPERLQRGLRELLPESRSGADALLGSPEWLRTLRDGWDAAGSWWLERVVNFNSAAQLDLLKALGLDWIGVRGMILMLAAGAAGWCLVLLAGIRPWLRGDRNVDPLGRVWLRFIALLAARGIAIAPHDGPQRIARHAARALPVAAVAIDRFAADYTALRFGSSSATTDLTDPRHPAVKALRAQLLQIARATKGHRPARTAAATRE